MTKIKGPVNQCGPSHHLSDTSSVAVQPLDVLIQNLNYCPKNDAGLIQISLIFSLFHRCSNVKGKVLKLRGSVEYLFSRKSKIVLPPEVDEFTMKKAFDDLKLLAIFIELHIETSKCFDYEFKDELKQSFYVNNGVASLDSYNALNTFVFDSTELKLQGGFELMDWERTEYKTEHGWETPVLEMK
ncbi:uncharacterized protein NPIL_649351 [Nephila pilipes]|uniref:Uncharacterized protein n=1 Tax=Nephila pilipes TaxID=299642 RepID=A0A8X6UBA2_NEPPI|nr:uncharacterized protein NPIL_649351 [Nephila pilipes]